MKVKKALFAVGVGVLVSGILLANSVSGMTYQDNVDVQFTFDPTIAMNLSTNRLTIDNLSPGNYNHSNTMLIFIDTNSVYGYTLFAKVGGTGQTAASSDLVSAASNAAFTSLNSSDKVKLANFGDNVWGYTTARYLDNDSLYSGLVYNDNSIINMTKNPSGDAFSVTYPGTNVTGFTIGAKASSSQVSGFYSNVITFTAVGNVVTDFTIDRVEYMQDFANMTPDEKQSVLDSMTEERQYKLKDSRDGKIYYVSKLKDGNIWMTQNLDHNIGDIAGGTYTSADTDLPSGSSWTPESNEYTTDGSSWNGEYYIPESYDPGNLCWNEQFASNWNTNLDTGTDSCTQNGNHFHVGNYYNWTAAVAMSNSQNKTGDVNQSICPAGWMLPKNGAGNGSFEKLITAYGWDGTNMAGDYQMWDSPLYFTLGGNWNGESQFVGWRGSYWSSVVSGSYNSHLLFFNYNGSAYPSGSSDYGSGFSVRCVVRR